MRVLWLRWLLVCAVAVAAFGVGGAASAHLPKVIVVQTDGGTTKVWTFGATVADALKDARVPVGPRDRVTPRYSVVLSAGMRITVRRAFPVLLVVDGGKKVVNTAAATVDEFIEESGVRLRSSDRVYPVRAASLSPGAMVRIVRIDTRIITKEERLPYGRIARPDAALPRGMTRLVQAGRSGTQVRRIAITTADGVVVDRQSLEAVITRPPQDRILGIGIRRLFASRGDFAGKEVIHMEATGYAPWHGRGVDGTTAIGLRAGYGVVAVDPQIIPLRSILYIEGYGQAIAGDTGGAIKGHRIDLGFSTAREAYKFGRRPIRVYILSTPQPSRPRR